MLLDGITLSELEPLASVLPNALLYPMIDGKVSEKTFADVKVRRCELDRDKKSEVKKPKEMVERLLYLAGLVKVINIFEDKKYSYVENRYALSFGCSGFDGYNIEKHFSTDYYNIFRIIDESGEEVWSYASLSEEYWYRSSSNIMSETDDEGEREGLDTYIKEPFPLSLYDRFPYLAEYSDIFSESIRNNVGIEKQTIDYINNYELVKLRRRISADFPFIDAKKIVAQECSDAWEKIRSPYQPQLSKSKDLCYRPIKGNIL